MSIVTSRITLRTKGNNDVHDLTERVARAVRETGVREGTATVFVTGSTAGVTTIEYEPGIVEDLGALMDRLIPRGDYRHHERWGDDNGHSHLRASLLGPSLTVPVSGGKLLLGTWQQVVLVDFDTGPRQREVVVQVVGE